MPTSRDQGTSSNNLPLDTSTFLIYKTCVRPVAGYREQRREALLAAVAIAALLVVAIAATAIGSGATVNPFSVVVLIVTLIAGAAGGWAVGPVAFRTRTRLGWAAVVLLLAITALSVGAVVIGITIGFIQAATERVELIYVIPYAIGVGLAYAFIGILVMGPFILPFTALAALVWAFVMAWRRRSAGV